MKKIFGLILLSLSLIACGPPSQETLDRVAGDEQQKQFAAAQPVPVFNWSFERQLLIELYNLRNIKAVTHSVWRSNTGVVLGDCPSMGFGIPYDTSMTNPLQKTDTTHQSAVVEKAEPNGIFASKNTAATWVMCVTPAGLIDPLYIEDKVSAFPYRVSVNYATNRVKKVGKSNVQINPAVLEQRAAALAPVVNDLPPLN